MKYIKDFLSFKDETLGLIMEGSEGYKLVEIQ